MTKKTFETIREAEGNDEKWEEAAKLFGENYGVWGPGSGKEGMPAQPSSTSKNTS